MNVPIEPAHYWKHRTECISEMALVFGLEAVKMFCKLNVWKYRYRAKDEIDELKADEYIDIIRTIERGKFWEMYK